MQKYRNRARSILTALILGAGVVAISGGTALANQPWTHAGNDHHGGYQSGSAHGNRHHQNGHQGHWRRQADNQGWHHGNHRDHQRRGDWHHHAWRHHYHHDHARTASGYRAYPPVTSSPPPGAYYAPPPTYYVPPALSFGINIPLGGQGGH